MVDVAEARLSMGSPSLPYKRADTPWIPLSKDVDKTISLLSGIIHLLWVLSFIGSPIFSTNVAQKYPETPPGKKLPILIATSTSSVDKCSSGLGYVICMVGESEDSATSKLTCVFAMVIESKVSATIKLLFFLLFSFPSKEDAFCSNVARICILPACKPSILAVQGRGSSR